MANPEQGPRGPKGDKGDTGARGLRGLRGPRGRRSPWDTLNEFRTSHMGVVIFYGYLVAILIAGVFIARVVRQNHRIAAQADRALCAQKHGYETTYRNGKTYLRKHPNGTADFSKDVIVAAILQAKVQLDAFKDVTCEP